MKLSIIIPVYNAEKYIEKCIESIFCNVDNSFEIIIINDGSKDKSLEIIERLMKKYSNISLINNSNNGVSYSRNVGIKEAQGDYIMFVDADDELKNNWYDEIKEYMNENDDIIYFSQYNLKHNKINLLKSIIGYNSENICIAGPCSKLFKKSLIEENKILFEQKIINGEDMLFNISTLSKANKIKTVKKSFYLYRRYVGQTTKKFDVKIFESDILFHKKLSILLDDYNITAYEKKELKTFCIQSAILMLYERISYIENFNNAKNYINKLYNLPYKLKKTKCLITNKNSRVKYIIYQMKFKYILYYLFKIIRKIKFSKSIEEYVLI